MKKIRKNIKKTRTRQDNEKEAGSTSKAPAHSTSHRLQ